MAGVIFDLDGVLADTEHLWEESWQAYVAGAGRPWDDAYTTAMQGMSSGEWARYLAEQVGRSDAAEDVRQRCVAQVLEAIDAGRGPLLPGAHRMVTEVGAACPIGLASSAARPVIERILATNGIAGEFAATVSSEEVPRGKPAPDVYLRAVQLVPGARIAVEDSSNGIRAASAAGLYVIAIPNPQYPPAADALALADHVASDHDDVRTHILEKVTS